MSEYYFSQERGYRSLHPEIFELAYKNRLSMKINGYLMRYPTTADIFNLDRVSKEVNVGKEQVERRLQRIFDDHLALLAVNASVGAMGFGVYYIAIKLRDEGKAKKDELFKKFLADDHICTGYETDGDYDFYLGAHFSSLDVVKEFFYDKYADESMDDVRLLPVQRILRQEGVNHWDLPASFWGGYSFDHDYYKKLLKIQNKIDETDLRIVEAINRKKPIEEYFNVNFFKEFSPEVVRKALNEMYEKRFFAPVLFLNWMKLDYRPHLFLVRLKPATLTLRRIEIADELAKDSNLVTIIQHNDSYFDLSIMAYEKLAELGEVRNGLSALKEVEEVKEAACTRQTRMWTHRLDDENFGVSVMLFD